MEIRFHGRHDSVEAADSLEEIIKLFHDRYHIGGFREMHLSVTLVDEQGADVELIDSETDEALRIFEVYRQEPKRVKRVRRPKLTLVENKGHK